MRTGFSVWWSDASHRKQHDGQSGLLSGIARPVSMHCDAQQREGQNMREVPAETADDSVLYARLHPFGGRLSKLDLLQGKLKPMQARLRHTAHSLQWWAILDASKKACAEHACRRAEPSHSFMHPCVAALHKERSELQLPTLVRASIPTGPSLAAVSPAAGFLLISAAAVVWALSTGASLWAGASAQESSGF